MNLTKAQWKAIKPLLPKERLGRPPRCRHAVLNALWYMAVTGVQWRHLPREYPPWQTVYYHSPESYSSALPDFQNTFLEAKDFGGTTLTANIPTSSSYQTVQITNINVTNSQCTIGIWSNASAGQWVYFDDVEFIRQ